MSSLPDDYHTLVTALEARDTKDLTLTLVQTKIIDEYMRNNNRNSTDFNNDFDQVMKIDSRGKKQIFCYYCKKPNHKMQQCRRLKEAQKGENKVNAVNDSGESSKDLEDEELLFMMT